MPQYVRLSKLKLTSERIPDYTILAVSLQIFRATSPESSTSLYRKASICSPTSDYHDWEVVIISTLSNIEIRYCTRKTTLTFYTYSTVWCSSGFNTALCPHYSESDSYSALHTLIRVYFGLPFDYAHQSISQSIIPCHIMSFESRIRQLIRMLGVHVANLQCGFPLRQATLGV